MIYIWDNLPFLIHGLIKTLLIAIASLLFSTIIAAVLGIASMKRFRVGRRIIMIYVEIFRDTPLIVSVFMIFFLAPTLGLALSPFWSIVVALSLWGGANGTEIVRSAFDSIEPHQWESSRALGLNFTDTILFVATPQAMPILLPAFTGLLALLVQGTALGALVGVEELFHSFQTIVEQTTVIVGINISPIAYLLVLCIYFTICFPISYAGKYMEERMKLKRKA